jgi:CRISPR/Cas system endoribonuclease Cas6 (RAMP superfamily)
MKTFLIQMVMVTQIFSCSSPIGRNIASDEGGYFTCRDSRAGSITFYEDHDKNLNIEFTPINSKQPTSNFLCNEQGYQYSCYTTNKLYRFRVMRKINSDGFYVISQKTTKGKLSRPKKVSCLQIKS